ncbi:hypothetical protein WR25_26232 [Diploscapter pachys]|uniref:G-protein coupled receptors family 1 profile domain-containing protein n=1 Tax=Diploscapter pachys TaxID=2018661 RepID=A0A2A2JT40_9BILA|nr:hypothetical protein WR25_26232 [Diploscapter pachys]
MDIANYDNTPAEYRSITGGIYLFFGIIGFLCNVTTVFMIATSRVYRLSAYTLMANVALADSVIMVIAGIICGIDVLYPDSIYPSTNLQRTSRSAHLFTDEKFMKILENLNQSKMLDDDYLERPIHSFVSFGFIAAWTAGVLSYAMLGMNRCIAICYYGTRARTLNRVFIAIGTSALTWVLGIAMGFYGSMSVTSVGIRRDLWSISFLQDKDNNNAITTVGLVLCAVKIFGLIAQWLCSTLVLLKIRQVKKKISKNKLNQNSANRFRKQFWLTNHTCNPFIYAYFNDRMRLTYKEILTCASLRYQIRKRTGSRQFRFTARHNVSRNMSRRSNAAGLKSTRMSARSIKSRDGNFVRNSLQMQSRDFEQLCEFIMRVNPLYDSSEGWRESSDEDEPFQPEFTQMDAMRDGAYREDRESKSIVLDLGRQTVEHWVKFAKKASI